MLTVHTVLCSTINIPLPKSLVAQQKRHALTFSLNNELGHKRVYVHGIEGKCYLKVLYMMVDISDSAVPLFIIRICN